MRPRGVRRFLKIREERRKAQAQREKRDAETRKDATALRAVESR